jgi:hypothetical protein
MLVWKAISSIVLMIRETRWLDSLIEAIAPTISARALFESPIRRSTSAMRVAARPECSAVRRVIDAISSIAADVSSSAAAWSLAPRERSWALDDTSLAADTTCCAPVRRSVAMRRMALDVPPPIVLARPSPTATDRRPIETRTLRAVAYVDSTAACTGCTVAPSAPWHRVHRGTVAPWHRGTVAPGAP